MLCPFYAKAIWVRKASQFLSFILSVFKWVNYIEGTDCRMLRKQIANVVSQGSWVPRKHTTHFLKPFGLWHMGSESLQILLALSAAFGTLVTFWSAYPSYPRFAHSFQTGFRGWCWETATPHLGHWFLGNSVGSVIFHAIKHLHENTNVAELQCHQCAN